jgi:hypothetical protein
VFIEEIYREWILPAMVKDMLKGAEFLHELSLDELQQVADALVECEAKDHFTEKVLSLQSIQPGEIDAYKQQVREKFMKGGSKRFIKILEGEFKDVALSVKVN